MRAFAYIINKTPGCGLDRAGGVNWHNAVVEDVQKYIDFTLGAQAV
jgi:hypothetical protein